MEKRLTPLGLALIPLLAGGVLALRGSPLIASSQDADGEVPIVFDPALNEAVNWALDASIQLELEHSELDSPLPERPRGDVMWFWRNRSGNATPQAY